MSKSVFLVVIFFLLNQYLFSQDYYRIDDGYTQKVDKFVPCKNVTNNCGIDIFVPIKTQVEWDAFVANAPPGVTFSECAPSLMCSDFDDNIAGCLCCDPANWTGDCTGPNGCCGDGANSGQPSPLLSGCWYYPPSNGCMIYGAFADGPHICP